MEEWLRINEHQLPKFNYFLITAYKKPYYFIYWNHEKECWAEANTDHFDNKSFKKFDKNIEEFTHFYLVGDPYYKQYGGTE